MGEPALDKLEMEALRGGLSAAATEEGEEVGVRVHWRRRARRRTLRRREAVGKEVAKWHGRWEAARWRRGRGYGAGGEAEREVRQWRELAVHVSSKRVSNGKAQALS